MSGPNTYHWVFGNGDHIEFPNGGNPTVVSSSTQIATYEGCATISDQNGQLLAYTDGSTLWDKNNVAIGPSDLGGHGSSTHSSIIVPPAGGGTNYHIFCIGDDTDNIPDQVWHSTFAVVGNSLNRTSGPTNITNTIPNYDNTERLAATSHVDCNKYWVITQNKGLNGFYAHLVDSEGRPTQTVNTPMSDPPIPDANQTGGNLTIVEQGYMKFSPDGRVFAWADGRSHNIHFHAFDNSNGTFTYMHSITKIDTGFPYGIEFSPDGNYLFYSILTGAPAIAVHDVSSGAEVYSAAIHNIETNVQVGALQLGPNGKIYGKYGKGQGLLEIDNPNLGSAATVNPNTIDSVLSGNISLNTPSSTIDGRPFDANWGLPTFTRIADDCLEGDVCSTIASEVNEITSERADNDVNRMRPCEGRLRPRPTCREFRYRQPSPHIEIKWGDSECDCIESDDTETVSITVCNTYSNIEFSGFTIHKLELVDAEGNPVATLPDGTPSVELTPIGPYCFGNIASCSCVSREFVLRNRGAIAGEYHIRATGICYDVNLYFDDDACFKFDICAD